MPFCFASLNLELLLLSVSLRRFLTSCMTAASKLRPCFHRTGSGHFANPDPEVSRMIFYGPIDETPLISVSPPSHGSLPAGSPSRIPTKAVSNILHTTKIVMFINPLNVLLPVVPIAIVCGYLQLGATIVFILNFLAIVPLSGLLGFATEEIAARLGQVTGGLLNATFGNAVELIVRKIPRSFPRYNRS